MLYAILLALQFFQLILFLRMFQMLDVGKETYNSGLIVFKMLKFVFLINGKFFQEIFNFDIFAQTNTVRVKDKLDASLREIASQGHQLKSQLVHYIIAKIRQPLFNLQRNILIVEIADSLASLFQVHIPQQILVLKTVQDQTHFAQNLQFLLRVEDKSLANQNGLCDCFLKGSKRIVFQHFQYCILNVLYGNVLYYHRAIYYYQEASGNSLQYPINTGSRIAYRFVRLNSISRYWEIQLQLIFLCYSYLRLIFKLLFY